MYNTNMYIWKTQWSIKLDLDTSEHFSDYLLASRNLTEDWRWILIMLICYYFLCIKTFTKVFENSCFECLKILAHLSWVWVQCILRKKFASDDQTWMVWCANHGVPQQIWKRGQGKNSSQFSHEEKRAGSPLRAKRNCNHPWWQQPQTKQ